MEDVRDYILQNLRQVKQTNRDEVELLRRRMELLKGEDRVLLTMYLENSNSFRQMSRLSGISDTSIARRINRIMNRLIDGRYIICLRSESQLTWEELAVAKQHFLMGYSMRKIAARRRCSYYRIRKIMRKINRLIEDKVKEK